MNGRYSGEKFLKEKNSNRAVSNSAIVEILVLILQNKCSPSLFKKNRVERGEYKEKVKQINKDVSFLESSPERSSKPA